MGIFNFNPFKKKNEKELLEELSKAFSELINICNRRDIPAEWINEILKFVQKHNDILQKYKQNYPNVTLHKFLLWIDSVISDITEIDLYEDNPSFFENQNKDEVLCEAVIDKIPQICMDIEDLISPKDLDKAA